MKNRIALTLALMLAALPAAAQRNTPTPARVKLAMEMKASWQMEIDSMDRLMRRTFLSEETMLPEWRAQPEFHAAAAKIALDRHMPAYIKGMDDRHAYNHAIRMNDDEIRAGIAYFKSPLGKSALEKERLWERRQEDGPDGTSVYQMLTTDEIIARDAFYEGAGRYMEIARREASRGQDLLYYNTLARIVLTTRLEFCARAKNCDPALVTKMKELDRQAPK